MYYIWIADETETQIFVRPTFQRRNYMDLFVQTGNSEHVALPVFIPISWVWLKVVTVTLSYSRMLMLRPSRTHQGSSVKEDKTSQR